MIRTKGKSEDGRDTALQRTIKRRLIKQRGDRCEVCGWSLPFPVQGWAISHIRLHHVIPIAIGGSELAANTVLVCPNCHTAAHVIWPWTSKQPTSWHGPPDHDTFVKELKAILADPEVYVREQAGEIADLVAGD